MAYYNWGGGYVYRKENLFFGNLIHKFKNYILASASILLTVLGEHKQNDKEFNAKNANL